MANSIVLSGHSAGVYIRNARIRKPSYSFKNYLETIVLQGAQNRVERDELKRGQGPYSHTRKEAVSMTARQMVSNNPNLRKVRVIYHALVLSVRSINKQFVSVIF